MASMLHSSIFIRMDPKWIWELIVVLLGCFTSFCYWPHESAWPNQDCVFQTTSLGTFIMFCTDKAVWKEAAVEVVRQPADLFYCSCRYISWGSSWWVKHQQYHRHSTQQRPVKNLNLSIPCYWKIIVHNCKKSLLQDFCTLFTRMLQLQLLGLRAVRWEVSMTYPVLSRC